MSPIRVIVISSVRVEPTSAGQLILHRHLYNQPGITLEVYGEEPTTLSMSMAVRRVFGRFGKTRFHRLSEDFWTLWKGRWLDSNLPQRVPRDGRTVVVTVAHGEVSMAALRFARKHKLPLVTFFHDWWPDIPALHSPAKRLLERNFRQLYHSSSVALCVCEGMKTALGPHREAPVLYPIATLPRTLKSEARNNEAASPFKLIYCGNLNGSYGDALRRTLEALDNHPNIRLEVRGANPPWPEMFKAEMRHRGQWLQFAPRDELDAWLATADAFLVPMGFEPHLRLRMETSFPSKIPEFTQFGKPLVIWGPEYCSAVQWARPGNLALCVTDPSPVALCQALKKLTISSNEQQRLAATARQAAQTNFSPDKIQAQFMEALRGVVKNVSEQCSKSASLQPSITGNFLWKKIPRTSK